MWHCAHDFTVLFVCQLEPYLFFNLFMLQLNKFSASQGFNYKFLLLIIPEGELYPSNYHSTEWMSVVKCNNFA